MYANRVNVKQMKFASRSTKTRCAYCGVHCQGKILHNTILNESGLSYIIYDFIDIESSIMYTNVRFIFDVGSFLLSVTFDLIHPN